MLNHEQIKALKARLPTMPPAEKAWLLERLQEYEKRKQMGDAKTSFTSFIKHVYPHYKFGAHHKKLISLFESVARGEKKRIIVNIAPRHGKSELISYLAPAWFLGNFPEKKVIMASHTADLAVDFGRKVRNLVGEDAYKQVFSDVSLQQDSKSASRWGTNKKGEYFAIGVGGALAGRGADLCLGENTVCKVDGQNVRLADVQVGQQILTAHGWQRVTRKKLTIHSSWFRINDIDASAQHPFLTQRGWVMAADLVEGDKILTLTYWRRLWITVSSLLKRLLAKRGKA